MDSTPVTESGGGCRISSREIGAEENIGFFEDFFGEFPEPVIVVDAFFRVVFLNKLTRLLTGRSTAQGPFPCSEILQQDASGERLPLFQYPAGKGCLERVHARLNCMGKWRLFSLFAQSVVGGENSPSGYVVMLHDIAPGRSGEGVGVYECVFPSIINHFPMPFLTVDTDLNITFMNRQLESLCGYKAGEVVNRMTCGDLFQAAECGTPECTVRRAMRDKASVSGVRKIIRDREGRRIPVSAHATILTDSEQRVIGGFVALRDITPVSEAEEKIRMLIDITQEGILMIEEDHRVAYANAQMAEILGIPREDIVGKDVRTFLPAQLLNITRDLASQVDPEHPKLLRFCSTIQRSETLQQEFKAFETCVVASRVGKTLVTGMYFHDLTKHIEIERQLFNTNSFLNSIIMGSADGIVVAGIDGTVMMFNEAAERILGYKAEEVIGVPHALAKVCSPEMPREMMRRMRNDKDGKVASTRVKLISKDGEEIPVSFSAAIIKKEGREIASVGIFSDLRERLRIRRELEEAKMQLMQAEKIASIGRLAAGVAHEINNPLAGILIYADILAKELAGNKQCGEDLQAIIDQTLRCKEIVTRLLNFSRQSVNQRMSLDINSVIRRSIEMLARQALFHDVEFVLDLQADIPPMTGDPGQLQQVFTNLIINAGTAMNGKGKIMIASGYDASAGHVVLQFGDTGPGIPSEMLDKIFEPFFTTKGPGEGTGLGLSVAYGIIQQHGGTLAVRNARGGGALFTIVLPLECPESQIEYT